MPPVTVSLPDLLLTVHNRFYTELIKPILFFSDFPSIGTCPLIRLIYWNLTTRMSGDPIGAGDITFGGKGDRGDIIWG